MGQKHTEQKIRLLCLTAALMFSTCTPAFAGPYQDAYHAAAARGDVAGMQAAHDAAVAAGQSDSPQISKVNPPASYGGGGNSGSGSGRGSGSGSASTSTTQNNTVYQQEYAAAAARGDTAGMEAAHQKALAAGVSNNPNYTKNANGTITTSNGHVIAGNTSGMNNSQLYLASVATDAYYAAAAVGDTSGEARAHNAIQVIRGDAAKASSRVGDKSVAIGTADGSGTVQIIDSNGNLTSAGQEILNQASTTYKTSSDPLIQNAAHDLAEVVRNAAGYSGGVDGTQNMTGSYDHSGTIFVTDDAVKTLLNSRGLDNTQANRDAAKNEIAGYKAYEDPTAGTMWEGGIHYQYDSTTHEWNAIEKLNGSATMSQEDLKAAAALKTQQEKQAAEFAALNNKTNRTSEEQSRLEQLQKDIVSTHDQLEDLRDRNGYTGGGDGGYVTPVIKNNNGGGSSSSTQTQPPVQDYYSITASATGHGSISPSGTQSIPANSDASFVITPANGSKIQDVVVDGVSKGAKTSWTFYNVTSAHSISVVFVSNLSMTTGNISVSGLTNGSIKAGYGFGVSVPCSSNGSIAGTCEIGTKAYTMEMVNGKLVLPRNPNSTSAPKARVHYIPVKTASGTKLPVVVTITATGVDGSTKTATLSATVLVKGNMYQDTGAGDR